MSRSSPLRSTPALKLQAKLAWQWRTLWPAVSYAFQTLGSAEYLDFLGLGLIGFRVDVDFFGGVKGGQIQV